MKDGDLHRKLLLDDAVSEGMYRQLGADSQFLSSCKIMDYSLLLGVYYTKIYRNSQRKRYRSVIHLDGVSETDEVKEEISPPSSPSRESSEVDYAVHDSVYVEGPGRYVCGVIGTVVAHYVVDLCPFCDDIEIAMVLDACFVCRHVAGMGFEQEGGTICQGVCTFIF